jgi:hypothetical protein
MNEFDQQEALLAERRKAYAQQLQGVQAPQGRMVGNTFVAANPLEYLAAGLRGVGALQGQEQANQELQGLQTKRKDANASAMANYLRQLGGAQENKPADGMGPVQQAEAPNLQGAYGALMQAPDDALRNMGMRGMAEIPQMEMQQKMREDDRAFRQQEAQLTREARAQELQMRMQDQRASQQEKLQAQRELQQMQIDARKDMQQMIASNRQAPQAQIIQTENGPMQVVNGRAVPIVGPDNKPLQAKPAAGAGNATEGERKAATLLQRMQGSEAQLEEALRNDKSAEKPGIISSGLRALGMETPANVVTPESRQKVEAAQLDILDAALTLGTGAAYTKEQLEGYRKSYFPQLGDKPETIKDKQVRLNNILDAARIAAGRAGGQVTAPPPPSAKSSTPKRIKFDAQGNMLP